MPSRRRAILVTGANGFVGRALLKHLSASHDHVTATSRTKTSFDGATTIVGDLRKPTFCKKAVAEKDIIYYLAAARKNIAQHTSRPFDFYRDNLEPLLTFLDALKACPPAILVYVSSVLVGYVGQEGSNDGYLLGKYASELALQAFAKQYGWDVRIVRAAAVYGPGDRTEPELATFIPSMIRKLKTDDTELVIWGKGTRKLQFIFIDDLAANLVAIGNGKKSGMFLVGNNESASVNAIARMIMVQLGKKKTVRHDLTKPDKPSQLNRFENPVPMKTSLAQGLKKTIMHS
ncbi:MAG: NAD(P)-dependent oxidoreductase [Patescibacteria group bacterium]